MSDQKTVWDHVASRERPAPTQGEIDAAERAVVLELSALGSMAAISVALNIIAAFLFADEFRAGSRGMSRYLTLMSKFIVCRVRQLESAEALVPADILAAGIQ